MAARRLSLSNSILTRPWLVGYAGNGKSGPQAHRRSNAQVLQRLACVPPENGGHGIPLASGAASETTGFEHAVSCFNNITPARRRWTKGTTGST